MKLTSDFYQRDDVVEIARDLLGKALFTNVNGIIASGMIVETEAYSWREKASHAYKGKTTRNAVMFEEGGRAYVYLCYGIHNLFNIVTNRMGTADAVLIRAIEPLTGVNEMEVRRNMNRNNIHLTSGPGKLTKALGIDRTFNAKFLLNDEVWVDDMAWRSEKPVIEASPRIGIDYAGNDALLPWRFTIKGNRWVSK